MVVAFAQSDQAFAEFETELFALKRARNPDAKALAEAQVVVKLKNLLDSLSGGTADQATGIALISYVYNRLIPRMAQPYWQED